MLKKAYDEVRKIESDRDPPMTLISIVAGFIEHNFPGYYGQILGTVCWLIISNKYPNCAEWLMESMDLELVKIVEELTAAINEVYLEVR